MRDEHLEPPVNELEPYWNMLEKMRENILEAMSDLERASLFQDVHEFRRIYQEEKELEFYDDAE